MFVTNTYCMSTYLINSLKVKVNAENVHLGYKHKLTDIFRSTPPSPPNNVCLKCPSTRPSATISFLDFSEIWYVVEVDE